ncbi:hypothetical protein NEIRO03_0135 [Nematocida sp. AWRm78]|nr:hypothetical protein NEIRO02_0051 [Nematocida sp. AWRm79]KAI5182451.1 hypothetical protein NEIRO03_0135 [Nematocida sp. AWRm78]
MEFVVESLWYIDNKIGEDVYQDASNRVYVIPKHAVPYSTIFAELDTFNKFCMYAYKKREDAVGDAGILMSLANICIRARLQGASMKELLQGYKESRILAEGKSTSQMRSMLKKSQRTHNYIKEKDIDNVFLESNTYISNLKPSQFYKMECNLARYFISTRQPGLAYKFAREALEMASRSASSNGIDESKRLLVEIEKKLRKDRRYSK